MSLLMDALRKAEQEKKEALKKVQDQGKAESDKPSDGDSPPDLTLQSGQDQPLTIDETEAPDPNTEVQRTFGAAHWKRDPEFSLSPINEEGGSVEKQTVSKDAVTPDAEETATLVNVHVTDEAGSDDRQASGPTFSETLQSETAEAGKETFPAQQTTEPGRPDTSSPTIRLGPKPFSVNDPTINEKVDLPRTGRHQNTKDQTREETSNSLNQYSSSAAHNVFAANGHSSSTAAWSIAALFSLVLIALVAYGIFYYYSVTPLNRHLPSPIVARGVESRDQNQPFVLDSIKPADKSVIDVDVLPVLEEIETDVKTDETISSPDSGDTTADSGGFQSTDSVAQVEIDTQSAGLPGPERHQSPAESSSDPEAAPSDDALTAGEADETINGRERVTETSPERIAGNAIEQTTPIENGYIAGPLELKPALVKISRSKVPEKQGQAVKDAYNAYSTGQYALAEDLYRVVLENDPDNRDALLGLAAIAVREGTYPEAYNHYMKLLKLNPADPIAKSALISLQDSGNPLASKSQILLLLEKHPNAAYLHYALGNIYARQQKWPEAQKAFFEAYSNDSNNPDYVFNLAVSLDRMGQMKTARQFYEEALRLARNGTAGFDITAVNIRIEKLNAVIR